MSFLLTVITFLLIKTIVPLYADKYSRTMVQQKPVSVFLVLMITFTLINHSMLINTFTYDYITGFLLVVLVIVAGIIDGWYMIIPDRLLAVFAPGIFVLQTLSGGILLGLFGAFFAFVLLLFLAIISKGGIGGGDIKLVTVLGLGTSVEFVYYLLFFSCLLAFVLGIIAILKKYRQKHERAPFGPIIALVAILLLIM